MVNLLEKVFCKGAGPGPTSSALMSDLLSILRGNIKYPFGLPSIKSNFVKVYNVNNYSNSLYLRFEVKDKLRCTINNN